MFERSRLEGQISCGEYVTHFMINNGYDYPGYKYQKYVGNLYSSDSDDDW